MQEQRYFYSIDGTDVQGPVSLLALEQLSANGLLKAGTHLCPEGSQEWYELSTEGLAPKPMAVRPKPPIASIHPAGAPLVERKSLRETEPWWWEEPWTEHPLMALAVVIWAIEVAWSAWEACTGHINFSAHEVVAFIGVGLGILLGPLIFCLIFFGRWQQFRPWVFCAGVLFLCILTGPGQLGEVRDRIRGAEANANAESDLTLKAWNELKANGYVEGDTAGNLSRWPQIRSAIGNGKSPADRMARSLIEVHQQLDEKTQAASDAAKLCNLDLKSLNGIDDLTARGEAVAALHDKAGAVIAFLQNTDGNLSSAMGREGFSEAEIDQALASYHQASHFESLFIEIWQSQARQASGYMTLFEFLKENAGSWNEEGGKFHFATKSLLDQSNQIAHSLLEERKTMNDLHSQMAQPSATAAMASQ